MAQRTLGVVDDAVVNCCSPLAQEVLSEKEAHAMALVYSALADPVRLRLLSLVASVDEVCSCHLEGPLAKSQPTVSHHTRILAEAGLIGILANLAGLALGIVLSLVLIFVINKQSFGWTIQFHWPVEVLVSALSLVYAATVLAGIYPARVAERLNPIEVVHEE